MKMPLVLVPKCTQCGRWAYRHYVQTFGYYVCCDRKCYITMFYDEARLAILEWKFYVRVSRN